MGSGAPATSNSWTWGQLNTETVLTASQRRNDVPGLCKAALQLTMSEKQETKEGYHVLVRRATQNRSVSLVRIEKNGKGAPRDFR